MLDLIIDWVPQNSRLKLLEQEFSKNYVKELFISSSNFLDNKSLNVANSRLRLKTIYP